MSAAAPMDGEPHYASDYDSCRKLTLDRAGTRRLQPRLRPARRARRTDRLATLAAPAWRERVVDQRHAEQFGRRAGALECAKRGKTYLVVDVERQLGGRCKA